jgi:hypothetical protein
MQRVSVERPLRRATSDRGDDLLPLLAEADGRYVADFARGRVPGLAEHHAIVLDPGPVPEGTPLHLFLRGWVYWLNSSGMRALSGRRDLAPEGPSLQVKDASGRWVTVIEAIGVPSGIDRTLIVDLTGKFLSDDRSVRIATNLAVYWDQAFFSTDAPSAGPTLHRLPPVMADLHHRGFSRVVREPLGSAPDFFDYAHLMETAPWNAAPGLYTRFGDVLTLVSSTDDRLAVMATGDEMTLAFDADALPSVPAGRRRDFVLRLTGWAKDHEPGLPSAGTVEPLPFHGMPTYPPPEGEGFPASLAGEEYRRAFQTRRMPKLIPDLAPLGTRQGPEMVLPPQAAP